MVDRSRSNLEILERAEVARIEAERRSAAEAVRVGAESRSAAEETCIAEDSAQLNQRGKSPQRRRHGSKWIGSRMQQRRSAPKHRVGEKGELVKFVRK